MKRNKMFERLFGVSFEFFLFCMYTMYQVFMHVHECMYKYINECMVFICKHNCMHA